MRQGILAGYSSRDLFFGGGAFFVLAVWRHLGAVWHNTSTHRRHIGTPTIALYSCLCIVVVKNIEFLGKRRGEERERVSDIDIETSTTALAESETRCKLCRPL